MGREGPVERHRRERKQHEESIRRRRRQWEESHPGELYRPRDESFPNWGEPSMIERSIREHAQHGQSGLGLGSIPEPFMVPGGLTELFTREYMNQLGPEGSVPSMPSMITYGNVAPEPTSRDSLWRELSPGVYINSKTGEIHGGRLQQQSELEDEREAHRRFMELVTSNERPRN